MPPDPSKATGPYLDLDEENAEDLGEEVQKTNTELEKLKRQLEDIEKQKLRLEELKKRQDELEVGRRALRHGRIIAALSSPAPSPSRCILRPWLRTPARSSSCARTCAPSRHVTCAQT